jgi:hypothetical protein
MSTPINQNLVYSLYISKETINNSLMSTFKGMLYRDTYNKYKQIHELSSDIQSMISDADKYKAVNPLEQTTEVPLEDSNIGVILVLPAFFLINPVKLDFSNIINPVDGKIKVVETDDKLGKIFDQILGYSYILFDINRNILCLYDLFISENILKISAPANITPYLDTVIQTNFLALQRKQLVYGLEERPNISVATDYSSPDISYEIIGQEEQYKLWGKIIMESIINTMVIFPYTATIWTCIDINNVNIDNWFDIMMHILLYTGFSNPYVSTKDPLNKDYNYKFIGLTKKNDIKFISETDISDEYNKVLYLFNQNIIECTDSQSNSEMCNCNMKFFFDRETILWLLRLPFNTQTINIKSNGTKDITQKEFSGAFKIKNIKCQKDIMPPGTLTEYYYTNTKGYTDKGYIAGIDSSTNKVKIISKSLYELKNGVVEERDFEYIDFKDLSEPCSYRTNNFVCELELDGRSVSYSGKRINTFDNLIDNIKQTYKKSSTVPIQTIKQTLNIIGNNLNTIKFNKEYYEKIQKTDSRTEIKKIKERTDKKIKDVSDDIKKKTIDVEKEIERVINEAEDKITSIIELLVKNNISNLGNILSGNESSVEATIGLIQFHTHPYQEYVKYGWTICFPSGPDFASFLHHFLLYGTIASAVITVEGLYIISINKSMCTENMVKLLKQAYNNTNLGARILDSFDFEKSKFKTPQDFCNYINNLKYDDTLVCNKINSKILQVTTNDFYVDEKVLYENRRPAKIISKTVDSSGNNLYEVENLNTGTIVPSIPEDKIHKHAENNKNILEYLKKYNLDTSQNIENDLKFLYGYGLFSPPIFKCDFKSWQELLQYDNKFDITYSQINKQCIMDNETLDIINELYNYPGYGSFYGFDLNIKTPLKLPKTYAPRTATEINYEKVSTPENILDSSFVESPKKGDTSFGNISLDDSPSKGDISRISIEKSILEDSPAREPDRKKLKK